MIGKTLRHFRVEAELGRGGMGEVYRARDEHLDRDVALKVLPAAALADDTTRKRFRKEALALSKLNHPNIATIHEFDTQDGIDFLVMEYVAGKTLKDMLPEGGLPEKEAARLGAQVATALEEAHEKGVVHRDLKPGNVIVTPKGDVKVLDFGIAKLVRHDDDVTETGTLTETHRALGTLPYMAPEQLRGEAVDGRTDLYALGTVLYEMATGRRPHRQTSAPQLIAAILDREPQTPRELNRKVSSEFERIILKCLEKDPKRRPQTARELRTDLERLSEPGPGAAVALLLRKPQVVIPALLILLALALGTGWWNRRSARILWAKQEALPEIERLVETSWRDFTVPYKLAEEAEKYIPDDPRLSELLEKSSLKISITTEPPDARIYIKEYRAPESEWKYLGISPIEKIRLPIGIFRWKVEKEGYETVLGASSIWDIQPGTRNPIIPNSLRRVLDEKGSIPPEMVRVTGAETTAGTLEDFYIDKYEVSNRKYKEFIDGGGYRNRDYWKHDFIKDGRVMRWEEATAEFVDQTGRPGPSTWQAGGFPEGENDYPVSGISWYEAAAFAESVGKSLPTGTHWGIARGEYTPLIRFPQLGGYAVFAPFSNFKDKGPAPVGSHQGITSYGAYDMAGNVREWCWNETRNGRLVRGGAWNDNTYIFRKLSEAPAFDRSSRNGFRCALYPDPEQIPESAFGIAKFRETRDFYKEKPVADPIFQIYKEQFSYDKTDLNARVESRNESSEDWIQEKITFDAAYGDERIIAYLFLPKNTPPPYQTVIYFPGVGSRARKSSEDLDTYREFEVFVSFIVKNGRAVLYPVYTDTFERGDGGLILRRYRGGLQAFGRTHAYTEHLIQWVKDFKRCIDYLETRQDIDSKKLAFYGMSWGGWLGTIIPAVEDRLEASVLLAGGLLGHGRPEANQINYVTRVETPTLMLNGKYDTLHPYETSIKPMFDLLGTPEEHKELKLYETDHIPPMNEFIKETLAWFDRYLGPVQ